MRKSAKKIKWNLFYIEWLIDYSMRKMWKYYFSRIENPFNNYQLKNIPNPLN